MRGDDLQQAGMFSYLSPEQRVPQDHPLRAIRKLCDAVFCGTVATVRQTLRPHGAPFDRTGEVAARAVAASALQRAQRATADGRTRLQHAVSLVRRVEPG